MRVVLDKKNGLVGNEFAAQIFLYMFVQCSHRFGNVFFRCTRINRTEAQHRLPAQFRG